MRLPVDQHYVFINGRHHVFRLGLRKDWSVMLTWKHVAGSESTWYADKLAGAQSCMIAK
jgi:hypothetical protein